MRHPEYPEYELILSTKFKNALCKLIPNETNCIEFHLKNILINGQKRGCSGFIRNKVNGNVVYISTEPIFCGFLRRYAVDLNDYTGCFNQFSKSLRELAGDVLKMLAKDLRGVDLNKYRISPY